MDKKKWWKSKTEWAALVTVALSLLALLGVGGLEAEKDTIVEIIMTFVVAVSGVVAFYGRLTAKTKIGVWLLLIMLLPVAVGCNGINMSQPYQRQVRQATIVVDELNGRCIDGDDAACRDGLNVAAGTLILIVDALDGKGGD